MRIGGSSNSVQSAVVRGHFPNPVRPPVYYVLFPWAELDRAGPQNLRFRTTHPSCGLRVDSEENEDRLVQLDAMSLQARTWNSVTILPVASTSDLVGVEVLSVGVAGEVLLSRRILVAADTSDTGPYVRPIDSEIRKGSFP